MPANQEIIYLSHNSEKGLASASCFDIVASNGMLDRDVLTYLGSRLTEGKAWFLVHPFFYAEESNQWEANSEYARLKQTHDLAYIPSIRAFVEESIARGGPLVVFQEQVKPFLEQRTMSDSHRDEYDQRKIDLIFRRLESMWFQYQLPVPDEIFLVFTRPDYPVPMLDTRNYGQNPDYIGKLFAREFRSLTSVESIVFAGSYVGGQPRKSPFSSWYPEPIRLATGETEEVHLTSNYYHAKPQETTANSRGKGTQGTSSKSHDAIVDTLSRIHVEGCVPYLLKLMLEQDVQVSLSSATFPEQFPDIADLECVEGKDGTRFMRARKQDHLPIASNNCIV